MKRILVAVDGSPCAEAALAAAVRVARAVDGGLIIAHVIDSLPADQFEAVARTEHISIRDFLASHSAQMLRLAADRAETLGARVLSIESLSGDVAETLASWAEAEACDMIVLGRRGRGRIEGMLLGSVSQKLAAIARCPVLIVPPG